MKTKWRALAIIVSVASLSMSAAISAQDDPYAKRIAKASEDGAKAIKRMRIAGDLQVDLWAAEPLLANPVAFCIDGKGRVFVAETYRLGSGTTDNRSHMYWLNDDLAARTVADRLAMYRKHLGKKFASYEVDQDRVRMVEDSTGKGRADRSTIFADGFKSAADGIGAGVIARGNKVWFTCIPDLWLLEDTKNTGRADVKNSLHTGYGVHVSFIGHDSHGLCFGPDGKLYFSIGDRGLHVETAGRTVSAPDTGSVLRCNPDGSDLEIFATGLRNPQKLVFDKFGNLFTGDNNADGGDAARWVHVVEGGDSGWRIGYQYMPSLGPWNAEKLWHKRETNTAAYLLPPLDHIASGPSGLAYDPGASLLPKRYRDHFFLCDFRGGYGGSGVWSFGLKARGASFELTDRHQFVWSVLATDCEFSPDGAFNVLDWVDGWGMPFKGRIYKVYDKALAKDPAAAEVRKLLGEGMSKRPAEELAKLLEHADLRIRQEAQFELAERKDIQTLEKVLQKATLSGRVHAIRGLGQIGRKNPYAHSKLFELSLHSDPEIRIEVIKALSEGEARFKLPYLAVSLLEDDVPQVRFHAALAAGRIKKASYLPGVLKMIAKNNDTDPYLRHAGVMALAGIADKKELRKNAKDSSPAVRRAVLLAMRRLEMPEVAVFLDDADATLVLEAARAIYDVPIAAALPELAKIVERPGKSFKGLPGNLVSALYLRATNAQFRLGTKENAAALAQFAGRTDVPEASRLEALKELNDWVKPAGRDRVVGLWRPLPERSEVEVRAVLGPKLAEIMTGPDSLRIEGDKLAAKFNVKELGPVLRTLFADKKRSLAVRLEMLQTLEKLKDDNLYEFAEQILGDEEPKLRHQGRHTLVQKKSPAEAAQMLAEAADKATLYERQKAISLLADLKTPESDAVLMQWLDRLRAKKAPAGIQLDILEAAKRRNTKKMKAGLAEIEKARGKADHLAAFRETLEGGDADAGRKIFYERAQVSCLRCHRISGKGGEVGPDLTGIGKKQTREYLLESIVEPNRQIAKGYDTLVLTLTNGQTKVGILKHEDPKEVRLMNAEGQVMIIPAKTIEERSRGKSAMPDDVTKHLSRSELRDLVEFLAGLR